ncbi:AAA family ATPase [Campylobacter peloridis]|uniref:AAA family ATPase n=1 Tax=Campylobacter peloridis TaxID=488546 RepID=UPI00127EF772|nr:AAA family ATPase [Campylobacter peloridis]EAK0823613.1 helicase DnaB [Campylobacter lari]EGK8010762.1 AAA family ATPase [Campylobacter lari]MBX1886506.1 AAA family ATPase [Campylobacter peloridis]
MEFEKYIVKSIDFQTLNPQEWFIKNLIPKRSLGVLYGSSGSGKTLIAIYLIKNILKDHNIKISYINADMDLLNLKNYGIDELKNNFKEKFECLNIVGCDNKYQIYKDYLESFSKTNLNNIFIVDSFNSIYPKIGNLLNLNVLYKIEQKLRSRGATFLFIHHTNKKGIFGDSQQIVDYADYTFQCFSNLEKKSILLVPKKSSRYESLKDKAFLFDGLKIIGTTEVEEIILSEFESKFIDLVFEILKIGTIKQNELIDIVYRDRRTRFGKNRIRILLQKHAKNPNGKWCMKQEPCDNNSIYYYLRKNKNEEK